jgi:Rap1a immunity proteins
MKTLWLIVVLLCCGTFASAQIKEYPYTSGNSFLRLCSSIEKEQRTDPETQLVIGCVLYLAGFVQGAEISNTATTIKIKPTVVPMPFCRPDGVENAQLVRVLLKYIRENPEDAHRDTMLLALWAFEKAFPCPSK